MINTIENFAKARGCKNAYEFWRRSGLNQATAYRLWGDPLAYPSKNNQNAICAAFAAQPGDFMRYIPEGSDLTQLNNLPMTNARITQAQVGDSIALEVISHGRKHKKVRAADGVIYYLRRAENQEEE